MKKRLISLLCVIALMLSLIPGAFAGYENFTAKRNYNEGQFTDVNSSNWFSENVSTAYEYSLIDGKTTTTYEPDGNLTIAETVKLAACLHSMYVNGAAEFEASPVWYEVYTGYALQNGILTEEPSNYNADASRAEFAKIFAAALPKSALTVINQIDDGSIPDVPSGADYENAVYTLYRAGILTGSNSEGGFEPSSNIKRSEAAAIVARMADPTLRKKVTIPSTTVKPVTPPQHNDTPDGPATPPPAVNPPDTSTVENELSIDGVSQKCMPAVFKLHTYDTKGSKIGSGSGVLISKDGMAATCAHVINGCADAFAELSDGTMHKAYIYDMDVNRDLACLLIDGSDLPCLELTDSISAGDKVYALGYPGGGSERIMGGNVKNPRNNDFLSPMIETSVVVYSGNSGGALVDCYGRLAGIVASSEKSGTPSFAIPVSSLELLDRSKAVSMSEYTASHLPDPNRCYAGLYPVPDFGKELNVPLHFTTHSWGKFTYFYRLSDLPCSQERAVLLYNQALNQNTFYLFEGITFSSSAGYGYTVSLSNTDSTGYPSICVTVTNKARSPIAGIPQNPRDILSADAA